jgi:glutaconate CoA-transferase subunit A
VKKLSLEAVVAQLRDGMTIGIGGWGSRRKPMALVRAILRSALTDLTIVSYGGPDVGLLCASGKVKKLVVGFVSLDSIPLEPSYRRWREAGGDVRELDEGMLQWGLYAAILRLPFLPTRAGLGSDVTLLDPSLRTVRSPYDDGEELIAMPAIELDAAIVHMNRADELGNALFLGPDPYFDDLFLGAAKKRFVTTERIVLTSELGAAPLHTRLIHRGMVDGVVEAPGGARFTECPPDYGRDEEMQRRYVTAATASDREQWNAFYKEYLDG